ncbi:DNA cytosine methyltransferase [Vibrio maritimus]|uniref:DNA cytosine methyltransferase n=1 Tax=Vibrio maritimus TaxID=990268 RepID=UPI004068B265
MINNRVATAVDLFAGAGGTSVGATLGGVDILWAANHNALAVETHQRNHPNTTHVTQDLHQADWSLLPKHDILYASPCCQGHSRARGKPHNDYHSDKSRSTAWAVISCLECHKTPVALIENVVDFKKWSLYPIWLSALKALGYAVSENTFNAKHHGVPQSRNRLILLATRTRSPLSIQLEKEPLIGASSFLDLSIAGHDWDNVANRVPATRKRVANARRDHGDIFIDSAYGSATSGHSIHAPIPTITTVNKHSLVIGDKIRPITIEEIAAAQTFPADYNWPASKVATKAFIGNAVPPAFAKRLTDYVLQYA